MSVDRSMRNAFAALLLVAALFVAMNRVVESAPLGDWWLPLVLLIVGLALIPNWSFSRRQAEAETASAESPALSAPGVRSYSVAAQPVPRLHTMTIRPDPETADYAVTVTDETVEVLPFMDATPTPSGATADLAAAAIDMAPAPVSPETPAPASEPEPEAATPVPVSPETPTPSAPVEPTVESPETSLPESAAASVDDLTRLNGIGAKSAAALKAAGIDSFHKLANSTDESIRAALTVGGVRLVGEVNTWTQQAAYAARGDWDGLKQFNAGRKATNGD